MPAKIPQHVREEQLNALPNMRFVRWADGYKNFHSKAVMKCRYGHEWSAVVYHLLKGRGCKKCALRATANKRAVPIKDREAQLNSLPGVTFVRWGSDGYKNSNSVVTVKCDKGHVRETSLNNLLNNRSGCKFCVHKAFGDRRRVPKGDVELRLNSITGVKFVGWKEEYNSNRNKVEMRCDCGFSWISTVNSILCGKGCPACSPSGFDPSKRATLYALRSTCGLHIKIGISNNYRKRVRTLERATPFDFNLAHLVSSEEGNVARKMERMFHEAFEASGFTGFDGATEWLKFHPDILATLKILGA